jgi:hypothetical protein
MQQLVRKEFTVSTVAKTLLRSTLLHLGLQGGSGYFTCLRRGCQQGHEQPGEKNGVQNRGEESEFSATCGEHPSRRWNPLSHF